MWGVPLAPRPQAGSPRGRRGAGLCGEQCLLGPCVCPLHSGAQPRLTATRHGPWHTGPVRRHPICEDANSHGEGRPAMNEGGPRTFESVRRGKVRGGRVQLSAGALWEGSETSGSSLGNPACVLRVASPHRAGLCGGDAPAPSRGASCMLGRHQAGRQGCPQHGERCDCAFVVPGGACRVQGHLCAVNPHNAQMSV